MRGTERVVGGAILAVATLVAGGQALGQTAPAVGCQADFASADRNGDGRLDRGEFHERAIEQFYLIDRDRNGHLVVAEVVGISAEVFRRVDVNGDGRLSVQEFANARYVDFVTADRNQDGSLTIEEIRLYSRC
jgi:Ca2+-binding EF-hand superfamily protein